MRRCVHLVLAVLLATWPVVARDLDGRYRDTPPAIKEWFRAQRAKGLPCCDIADGHETLAEKRADGHYWVPIEGRWWLVPDEAVIVNVGNPVGSAVVWYIMIGNGLPSIRCFVPGPEG